jgi:hypothetical protein
MPNILYIVKKNIKKQKKKKKKKPVLKAYQSLSSKRVLRDF